MEKRKLSQAGGNRFEVSVRTKINGEDVLCRVPSNYTLAELLRERLNLTGTKLGCNRAECGVCTVLLDDLPVFACTSLAVEADGRSVETIEGIGNDPVLGRLRDAFVEVDALQCGFCTPGIMMSLKPLFRAPAPVTRDQVKDAISGNYCRCGAYQNIFRAAMQAINETSSSQGRSKEEEDGGRSMHQ